LIDGDVYLLSYKKRGIPDTGIPASSENEFKPIVLEMIRWLKQLL